MAIDIILRQLNIAMENMAHLSRWFMMIWFANLKHGDSPYVS